MFLGRNIRLIRKKWRYKQGEFGDKFDVKGQSISTYEKGTTEPRINFLLKLSEMSGITINDLCNRPIKTEEIPEKPLYAPQTAKPADVVKEPVIEYDQLRPEDIAEPLYNAHILVSEVRKLRDRVDELEKQQDDEDEESE